MDVIHVGWRLAAVLVLLAGAASLVVRWAELGRWQVPLTAAARAVLQLAVVSALIGAALRSMWGTPAFVLLMVVVATLTSCRRITGALGPTTAWLDVVMLAALVPVWGLVVATEVVPFEPIAVLPVAGILIGGAMSATTLAGRRLTEELEATSARTRRRWRSVSPDVRRSGWWLVLRRPSPSSRGRTRSARSGS